MSINGNSELIVRYDGSKASFESTNGPKNTYIEAKVSKVVFITGSTARNATAEQKRQYIWITDGSSEKYIDMSNVADIQKSLTHIAGFAIDGSQATIGAGQNGLNFVGANGIKIALNPTISTDKNGVPYWSIEIDGDDIKAIVESADAKASSATAKIATILGVDGTSNKSIRTIASEEAGKVETALKGNSSTDSKDSATIAGAKKYADAAITNLLDGETISGLREDIGKLEDNKADLENGKIPTTQLPDYILGQLLFGGTVSSGTSTTMVVTPSGNYKLKHTVPASHTTVTINKDTFATHEGEYFIATAGFTAVGVPVNTGDWIVSTGTDWKKIDNTDAITKVAGVVPTNGDVSKDGLATALGVDKKYEMPSSGIPKSDLEEEVQTSLDKIDSMDSRVGQTEDDIDALQAEQGTQKAAILQQAQTISSLNTRIDGVNESVTEANKAIETIETVLEDKASQSSVNSLSSSVTTLESRISSKADHTRVLALEVQIDNKVEKDTYNAKVATLEASINANTKDIELLEGYSEEVANDAEGRAKAYTNEKIAAVDVKLETKANAGDVYTKTVADETFATITHAEEYAEKASSDAVTEAKKYADVMKSNLEQHIDDEIRSAVTALDAQFENKVNKVDTKNRIAFVTYTERPRE